MSADESSMNHATCFDFRHGNKFKYPSLTNIYTVHIQMFTIAQKNQRLKLVKVSQQKGRHLLHPTNLIKSATQP